MITTTDLKEVYRNNWFEMRALAIKQIQLCEKQLGIPPAKSALISRRERRKLDNEGQNKVNY